MGLWLGLNHSFGHVILRKDGMISFNILRYLVAISLEGDLSNDVLIFGKISP